MGQDVLFKLIIIGNSGVGKSCLMNRITTNEFSEDHEVTVGVDFGSLVLQLDTFLFKLQIWDTAGQEAFQAITKIFYRGAHAVLLTYSITSNASFLGLKDWLNEVRNEGEQDVLIVLVGNQSDRDCDREVSRERAEKFKNEHNLDFFIETSAKSGDNIEKLFTMTAKMLYKQNYSRI